MFFSNAVIDRDICRERLEIVRRAARIMVHLQLNRCQDERSHREKGQINNSSMSTPQRRTTRLSNTIKPIQLIALDLLRMGMIVRSRGSLFSGYDIENEQPENPRQGARTRSVQQYSSEIFHPQRI